jgi:hypothetical protein
LAQQALLGTLIDLPFVLKSIKATMDEQQKIQESARKAQED